MAICFILTSFSTSFLTYFLAQKLKISSVLSSVLVTLLFIGVIQFIAVFYQLDTDLFMGLIFGASFVGMTKVKNSCPKFYLFSSLIYTLLFLVISPFFSGLGGTLGFLAFVSVVVVQNFFHFSKKIMPRLI